MNSLLADKPYPTLQRSDVSDDQVLRSQAESPTVTDKVNEDEPILAPWRVMLTDPVTAAFDCLVKLRRKASKDTIAVDVPAQVPTEYTTRLLPPTPSIMLQRIVVSACQVVLSDSELPIFKTCVKSRKAMLAPCTVTLLDPVVALFVRRRELKTLSVEKLLDTLPDRSPIVRTNLRLFMTMCAA